MGFFDRGKNAAIEAKKNALLQEMAGQLAAVDKSRGSIEISLDGTILTANNNFLKLMGYSLDEIKGAHHSMFVDSGYRESTEYHSFLKKLGQAECYTALCKRISIVGKELWLQASYNPIMDANGKPYKVIKYVTDVTEQKKLAAHFESQSLAINNSLAVIEFSLDGIIITANDNFLNILGYSQDEIRGKHHRILVDPVSCESPEYRLFWEKLSRGEYAAGQYKRIGKDGKGLVLQASYNPVMDANGQPCKVVKFAQDISWQVAAAQTLKEAIAQAQLVLGAPRDDAPSHSMSTESTTSEFASLCSDINALVKNLALQASAAEVSNTGQHSSNAAKEIKTLITNSVANVESETAQITKLGLPMNTANNTDFSAPAKAAASASRVSPVKKPVRANGAFLKKIAIDEWEGF